MSSAAEDSYDAGVASVESLSAVAGAAGESLAELYPRILLDDGSELVVAAGEYGPEEVDATQVGEFLATAQALPLDAEYDAILCDVYALADGSAYAVRYEGEDAFWLYVER